ncbi:Hypothetical protein Bdt_3369 [Bdellovibrio bacteriovorus str. Tiberius]|uniref:Uncharacterized protein n=1 Tax=Bdellovibrio bacteriovorus str. Tiberius TaxID=1069642 RepID=K7ZCA3_BDEBC|nr:Hypothetical protein Bdt_3369 [Bdellovibrio bacteriovorus str. Tiberius]
MAHGIQINLRRSGGTDKKRTNSNVQYFFGQSWNHYYLSFKTQAVFHDLYHLEIVLIDLETMELFRSLSGVPQIDGPNGGGYSGGHDSGLCYPISVPAARGSRCGPV